MEELARLVRSVVWDGRSLAVVGENAASELLEIFKSWDEDEGNTLFGSVVNRRT